MKIYALSGPPGAGKTFYRKKKFPGLPFFDIADVYAEFYGIKGKEAFAELLNRITTFASIDNVHRDIVVEAMLARDSTQRKWLDYIGEANGYQVEYIELDTPLEMCILRVRDDWKHANQDDLVVRSYFSSRIRILKVLLENQKNSKEHAGSERSHA